MLTYEIEGKTIEVLFTLDAIDALDHIYTIDMNGIKFGAGIQFAFTGLEQASPVAIANVLQAVQVGTKTRVGKKAIMMFLIENDNVEEVANALAEELKKQPLTKTTVKRMAV